MIPSTISNEQRVVLKEALRALQNDYCKKEALRALQDDYCKNTRSSHNPYKITDAQPTTPRGPANSTSNQLLNCQKTPDHQQSIARIANRRTN